MARDGVVIMEKVGLERRRMRRFGESKEMSYGGIWEGDSKKDSREKIWLHR